MNNKPPQQKHVSFNIFGGESLFHPNIIDIIEYAYNKHNGNYAWTLGLNTVTNAIVKPKVWDMLLDYFDYLTVSYHTESTIAEQELFRRNVLELQKRNKRFQASILLHPINIQNCKSMIDWCKDHDIPYWARKMDTPPGQGTREHTITLVKRNEILKTRQLGRSCCGGQKFNVDQDYTKTVSIVPNNFMDWNCGVNHFFIFVKQETKEVFINKDCLMSYDSEYGPIGSLTDPTKIVQDLKYRIENGTDYIVCKKERCWCGLCSPKAKDKVVYDDIMKKYHV
jgi:hypothetical protein